MKSKKGQLGNIQAMIVPLAAVAILLVIGFLILAETKTQAIDKSNTLTTTLSNITIVVDAYSVINVTCVYEEDVSINGVHNGSGIGTVGLNAGNWTVSGNTINISDDNLGTNVAAVGTKVELNFTCQKTSLAINSTRTTQGAMDDIPGWLPIIVVTIIGAALIGLISLFAGRRQ